MATTRAVYRRSGGSFPQTLTLMEEPIPPPGPNDILIKVHAASLNYRDINMLRGGNPWSLKDKGIPTSDAAGEVVEIGREVSRFQLGDRLMPILDQKNINGDEDGREWLGSDLDGVLASHIVFPEQAVVKIPKTLSWEEAACLPCAALTAWSGVNGLANLGPGNSVLITGTGGVSMMALKFVGSTGAKVILTSSSNAKAKFIKAQFSTSENSIETINYTTTPDWHEEVLRLTNGQGVDLVIENGGGESLLKALKATKRRGQVSSIGYLGGSKVDKLDEFLPLLIDRTVMLKGINVGSRRDFEEMCAYIKRNDLRFEDIIAERFHFQQAPEAFEHLESGVSSGKIVITVP
jgi:NADPH:quinone reductase-like Zn-dependent oxidoreductase